MSIVRAMSVHALGRIRVRRERGGVKSGLLCGPRAHLALLFHALAVLLLQLPLEPVDLDQQLVALRRPHPRVNGEPIRLGTPVLVRAHSDQRPQMQTAVWASRDPGSEYHLRVANTAWLTSNGSFNGMGNAGP